MHGGLFAPGGIVCSTKILKVEFLPLDWIYSSIRVMYSIQKLVAELISVQGKS